MTILSVAVGARTKAGDLLFLHGGNRKGKRPETIREPTALSLEDGNQNRYRNQDF